MVAKKGSVGIKSRKVGLAKYQLDLTLFKSTWLIFPRESPRVKFSKSSPVQSRWFGFRYVTQVATWNKNAKVVSYCSISEGILSQLAYADLAHHSCKTDLHLLLQTTKHPLRIPGKLSSGSTQAVSGQTYPSHATIMVVFLFVSTLVSRQRFRILF